MSDSKLSDVRVHIGWIDFGPMPVFGCTGSALRVLGVKHETRTVTGEEFNRLYDARAKFQRALAEYQRIAGNILTAEVK